MFFKRLLAQSKDLSSCAFHAIQLGKLSAIFIKTSQDNDNPDIAGIKAFWQLACFSCVLTGLLTTDRLLSMMGIMTENIPFLFSKSLCTRLAQGPVYCLGRAGMDLYPEPAGIVTEEADHFVADMAIGWQYRRCAVPSGRACSPPDSVFR